MQLRCPHCGKSGFKPHPNTIKRWRQRFADLPSGLTLARLTEALVCCNTTAVHWARRLGYPYADGRRRSVVTWPHEKGPVQPVTPNGTLFMQQNHSRTDEMMAV